MKRIYLISENPIFAEATLSTIHFDFLVHCNDQKVRSGVWTRWKEETKDDSLFHYYKGRLFAQKQEVGLTKGRFFPERWLWEDEYENILIFGSPEEMKIYVDALMSRNGYEKMNFPEGFVYKIECEREGNDLKMTTHRFLYHSHE